MKQDKTIDRLTRLLNDTFMEEEFDRELKRAERYKRPLTFLLIDPDLSEDDFLTVGYLSLKKVAAIAREVTRYLDFKIRLKNRVLILLPETDFPGALKVALKIQHKLSKISFREFPEVKVVGKIGIAAFPEDGIDRKSILKALEQDLEKPMQDKIPEGFEPIDVNFEDENEEEEFEDEYEDDE